MRSIALRAFVLATSTLAAACGGSYQGAGTTPGGTPTPTVTGSGIPQTLTLTATPGSIPADNTSTATLTAKLTDTTNIAISAAALTFSSNAGTFPGGSAISTGTDGIAVARLRAGVIMGRATVTVRHAASGLSASVPVSFTAGPAAAVTITVAPATVRPGGTASLSINVADAAGNPVSGEVVTLSVPTNTSGGSLAATSLLTDSNGRSSTNYTAGVTTGGDSIRAQLASGAGNNAALNVSAAAAQIASVALTVGNATPVADGSGTVVRAVVTDTAGQLVNGAVVAFSSTAGSVTASATTDATGTAQGTLTSPNITGTATVRASTGGFTSSQGVTFVAGPATAVGLSASPPNMSFGQTSTLRALVTDTNGNPVPNEGVIFRITANGSGGNFTGGSSVTTDSSGVATTSYQAGAAAFTSQIDSISAGVAAGASSAVNIAIAASVGSLSLSSANGQIIANGTSNTTLTTTIRDANGNPVSGATVSCTTSAGTIAAVNATTGSNGTATFRLTSSTITGNAVAVCGLPGLSATTVVQFIAGPPATVTLTASPGTVSLAGTSTLTATVFDANSNVVAGEPLQFAFTTNGSGATLGSAGGTTDGDGRATVNYVAGSTASSDTVRARTAGGISNSTTLTVSASTQVVQALTLSIGGNAPGTNASVQVATPVGLRATVTDTGGTPIAGVLVSFTSTDGSFVGGTSTATSDSNGHADVSIITPTYATTGVIVTASASGLLTQGNLTVVPGAPNAAKSSITANPTTLIADGASTTTVTVILNDAQGNPVADGRPVTLLTTPSGAGTFVPGNTATTSSGRATFTLQAPSASANASISVQDIPTLNTPVTFASPTANTTGDPASIQFVTSSTTLSVAGVGQTEQLSITATVRDSAGNVIAENFNTAGGYPAPINNLRVEFVTRPNGGETLTGKDFNGAIVSSTGSQNFVDVATSGGVAVLTLHSGTIPGIVEIKFSVLKFAGTAAFAAADVASTGSLPQVSIASGPPHTIAFTHPITNSIANLGGGSYRRRGQAIVTDRYGNHVPDGTVMNFSLIDSVIAQGDGGTIAAGSTNLTGGSSLINRTCTGAPAPSGGEASSCTAPGVDAVTARDFTSTIVRNNAVRGVQANDRVYVLNADGLDKSRVVGSTNNGTMLTVQSPYLFPAGQPTAGTGQYWIGSSLSGGFISGCNVADANCVEANLVTGTGVVFNGISGFRVTYPANVGSILSGCYGYQPSASYRSTEYTDIDRRDAVPQSRQVVIGASSGNGATGVDAGQFCFGAIAPVILTGDSSTYSVSNGSPTTLRFLATDGGDLVPLPYVSSDCFVTSTTRQTGSAAVFTVTDGLIDGLQQTSVAGYATAVVSVTGAVTGDQVSVSCIAGGARTSFTVNVP